MTTSNLQQCIDLVARALNCPTSSLSPDAQIYGHPNWDSLGQLQIIIEFEYVSGVAVPDDRIQELTTIQGIVAAFEELSVK